MVRLDVGLVTELHKNRPTKDQAAIATEVESLGVNVHDVRAECQGET